MRVAIVGSNGRMGTSLLEVAPEFDLETIALDQNDPLELAEDVDCIIDFSSPDGTVAASKFAALHNIALVSGTTGLTEDQQRVIEAASSSVAVLQASNFSVGVNVLERLVELASNAAPDFDLEIFEAHHRNKVDAPSGTALFLGRAAARGRKQILQDSAVYSREGQTEARTETEIGFQVVRGGSVVGTHTVMLLGNGEEISLTHRASDRAIFARGALRAACWIMDRPVGLYQMADVLFGE